MQRLIIVAVLLTVVIIFNSSCTKDASKQSSLTDTLLLQSAYAQSETTQKPQITEEIYQSRQNAITQAVAKASPAVVGITVIEIKRYRYRQRNPFSDDPFWRYFFPELFRDRIYEQQVPNLGSGFLISPDGYILTNDHVAGDGVQIVVTLPGGEKHQAELVGTDRVSDISLLKVEGNNFPHIEMGNSNELIVGEWVIALGNPFGLFELSNQPTVTVGVISAINRDWGEIEETGNVYLDMIQTDAAINQGNSGGPLVNSLGEAIGMNTFIYTGSQIQHGFVGIGFAIPINRIREILDDLKTEGEVNRNFEIGLGVQNLNQVLVNALRLKVKQGVLVTQIDPGTSAARAGFQLEDVIISVNNQSVKNTKDLREKLSNMDLRVGDTLDFAIVRNGKNVKLKMKLIEKG